MELREGGGGGENISPVHLVGLGVRIYQMGSTSLYKLRRSVNIGRVDTHTHTHTHTHTCIHTTHERYPMRAAGSETGVLDTHRFLLSLTTQLTDHSLNLPDSDGEVRR